MSAELETAVMPPKPEVPAAGQAFPRNQWYVAAGSAELGRHLLGRKLLGEQLVLFRRDDGRPVAMSDWCPHRGFRLSKGKLIGDQIQCGYHGMRFDSSGACVGIPTQKAIPTQMRVRSYPLVEKWLWAWIWMGDPSKADPALIPHTGLEDKPYHHAFHFCFPMNGNFQLVHDNLLDGTHVSFLHAGTLDSEEKTEVTDVDFSWETKGSLVRIIRRFHNFVPTATVARSYALQEGVRVDRLLVTEHYLPSFVIIINRFTDPTDPSRIVSEQIVHIPVTPADRAEAYHFAGTSTSYPCGTKDDTAFLRGVVEQDRLAVETVQSGFDQRGSAFREVSLRADAPGVQGRRIVASMVAAEVGN
jgi:vanillate monooxygenase